jgi:TatA/E family protein of Tat protein translocase
VSFGIGLLVFGPKKLAELGKGIGEGIHSSKSVMNKHDEAFDNITITGSRFLDEHLC